MEKLAIDGGKPVLTQEEIETLIPQIPVLYPETEQRLVEVYRSRHWGGGGTYEKKLTQEFAAFQDCKYSVWMSNGTTTLECALLALGIGPGDEVIVPGITWIATAEAAIYVGANPVLIDVDPETICMDPSRIEEAITPRTKAIIPVHVYSALANMDKINAIAEKHGLYVIEDCAHAHGAKQHGKGVGSLSSFGSFSFQMSKLMTGGEGGCLVTNDERLADRAQRLSHIGNSVLFPKEPLEQGLICHQYRMTEFQSAVIYDQLQHQAEHRAKRQASAAIIRDMIKDFPAISMQKSSLEDDLRDYYFITFLVNSQYLKEGIDHTQVMKALWDEGVHVSAGWGAPLYKHKAWNLKPDTFTKMDTPNCEDIMYNRIMCAMYGIFMADESVVRRWGEAICKVMKAYSK